MHQLYHQYKNTYEQGKVTEIVSSSIEYFKMVEFYWLMMSGSILDNISVGMQNIFNLYDEHVLYLPWLYAQCSRRFRRYIVCTVILTTLLDSLRDAVTAQD